jgi:hypothetical protein
VSLPRALLLTVLLVGSAGPIAAAAAEENRAATRLDAMASTLTKATRLGVTIDCVYDVVQDSGAKIEFGERRTVVIRRPDRARIDVVRRDGARRGVIFDGKELTAFDLDAKVYTTVSKPGTVDAALDYFVDELQMRLPLRELLKADVSRELKEVLPTAQLVGEEQIGGVATDHVAFRGKVADVQIWIPRDGDPLPKRIVLTYRLAVGQPQFHADFSGWTLAPDAPDGLFAFTPAAGAERIPVLVPRREKKP